MLDLALDLGRETTIRVWKMEEDLAQIEQQTDLSKIKGYEKLSPKRKKEKAFIQYLLQQQLPGQKIEHEESGKPYLTTKQGISVSHTGNYACLMLSNSTKTIGVDIEKNDTAKVLRVRHKFMTPDEVALMPTPDEGTNALLAWTTKEALFKLVTPPHYDFIEDMIITQSQIEGDKGNSNVFDPMNNASYKAEHLIKDGYVLTYIYEAASPTTIKP